MNYLDFFGKRDSRPDYSLELIRAGFEFARMYIKNYNFLNNIGISNYKVLLDGITVISNNNSADFYLDNLTENTSYAVKVVITLSTSRVYTFVKNITTPLKNTNSFFSDVTSYYPMGEVGSVPFEQRFENILDRNTYLYATNSLNNEYKNSPIGLIGPETYFNGFGDREAYRKNANLVKDTTVGFSVCFIVTNFGGNALEPAIMSMYKNAGAIRQNSRFGLEISSDGKLHHWSGSGVYKGSTVISDGNPHIVFMIQDVVNNTLQYYVDNNLEISTTAKTFQQIEDSRTTFGGYDNLTGLNSKINLSGILYKESPMTQTDRDYLYNNGNYRKLDV